VATRGDIRKRIEDIAIIPSIRAFSVDDARFAVETLTRAGIPIIEVAMTAPHAVDVITHLTHEMPDVIVGAGTVFDAEMAKLCVQAGARFLASPGLDMEIVDLALEQGILAIPGALTPTEVTAACKGGADFIKIFPVGQVGGASYIHALKGPFPDTLFVAAGGVNQQSAAEFIAAGAAAIGVGTELVPKKAVEHRDDHWITELARRFLHGVHDAKAQRTSRHVTVERLR
jgi:2-dehydro-3-deoxyphosphogluconate aldolase / (4S)-4-hydroxy-2-oxoglutarate aldolase